MTRRSSARRASAAMQEALHDSSDADEGGSESELASPSRGATRSNSLRRKKKGVKKTDNVEEENGRPSFPDMDSRPKLSPTKTYSLKRKRREEAAAAQANGDASSLTDDSETSYSTPKKTSSSSSPVRKATAVKKGGGSEKEKGKEKEKAPVKEKPKPKPTPQVTLDLSGLGLDDESDLTPLSSSSESEPEPEPESPKPVVVAKVKAANGNHHSSPPRRQVRGHPMFAAPSASTSTSKTTIANGRPPKSSWEAKEKEDEWNREDLGTFVWVRLDGKNSKTASVYTMRSKSKESLWWPASVHSSGSKSAFKVTLFGNGSRTIAIEEPSSDNIRSRLKNFSLRFDSYEAALQTTVNRGASVAGGSPRKKQKLEDENKAAWDDALREMQEAFLDSDDLPDAMEALSAMNILSRTASSATVNGNANGKGTFGRGKRKRRQSEAHSDLSEEEEPEHEPPLENESLDIPGEGVLARSAKTSLNEYWPAKLLEYIPPKKKEKEGKYKIVFLDTTQEVIPRKFFYTQHEDGYLTCKLGQIQSAVVDDTNDLEEEEIDPEALTRSPSPPCRNPPPDQNKFVTLSLRQQFAYVKPILQAILNNQYKPTEKKVRIFMSGRSRQQANLSKLGADRGMMDPRQVNELIVYLKHWCLRNEQNVQPRSPLEFEDAEEHPDTASGPASAAAAATEAGPSISVRPSSPTPTEAAFASSPGVEPPSSSFSPLTEAAAQDEPADDGPPRQTGSPEYEALSALQRLDFCLNILLLEAIRQILLWRAGTRRSIQLLSPEEEERLYKEGHKLLQERDWVHDVLRVRQRLNGMRVKTVEDSQATSRSGRRTKAVNYAE